MFRTLALLAAICGVGLMFYDAIQLPWSQRSLFFDDHLFGNSLDNGGIVLLIILFLRLGVLRLLIREAYQAIRWYQYRGTELRSHWMHDFSRDAR